MHKPTDAEAARPPQELRIFQEARGNKKKKKQKKRNPLCSRNAAQTSKARACQAPPAARTQRAHPAEPCHGQGELGDASRVGSAPSARRSCPAQVCTDTRTESWTQISRPEQLCWVPSSRSPAMAWGRLAARPRWLLLLSSSDLLQLLSACKGHIPPPSKTGLLPTGALGEGVGSNSCCGIARVWGGAGIRAITWGGGGMGQGEKKKKKRSKNRV